MSTNFRYDQYQERKAEANAKFRAKRAREEVEEWDGIHETNGDQNGNSSDSESDSEEEVDNPVDSLLTSLKPRLEATSNGQLSERAALFYDRPEFEAIGADDDEDAIENGLPEAVERIEINQEGMEEDSACENGFEEVPSKVMDLDPWNDDSDNEKPAPKQGTNNPHINLTT
jgi:AdoMet-dependent rRNA methyltransferase SPB1